MKKRLEKKVEKMRRKKVHEILEMVLEINGTHSRASKKTGSKPTAFFDFYGHTAEIVVNLHKNGWEFGSAPDFRMDVYIDMPIEGEELPDLKEGLENVMEELRHAGKM